MHRATPLLLVLPLLLALAGCGAAGGLVDDVFPKASEPPVLRQAVYTPGSGRYAYAGDFGIGNAPDDADFTRWAMCHDGTEYELYVMRGNGPNAIYRFEYDDRGTYLHTPAGDDGAIPIVGAPTDTTFASIAMVHGQGRTRLYALSRSRSWLVHQFVLADGARPYFEYVSAFPVTGLPSDADPRRWAMHEDGSNYRILFFKRGSGDALYQCAFNPQTGRYEYGYNSRDVVVLVDMPEGTDRATAAALHDGAKWRMYQLSSR